jgi:hypothetical protein
MIATSTTTAIDTNTVTVCAADSKGDGWHQPSRVSVSGREFNGAQLGAVEGERNGADIHIRGDTEDVPIFPGAGHARIGLKKEMHFLHKLHYFWVACKMRQPQYTAHRTQPIPNAAHTEHSTPLCHNTTLAFFAQ